MERDNVTTNHAAGKDDGWTRYRDESKRWLWPVLAMGALLFAGLLYLGNIADRQPSTQVIVEATPTTKPNTSPTQ